MQVTLCRSRRDLRLLSNIPILKIIKYLKPWYMSYIKGIPRKEEGINLLIQVHLMYFKIENFNTE